MINNQTAIINRNKSLNPDFNTFLTNCSNSIHRHLTDKEKQFLKIAYKINMLSGIPFTVEDFKEKMTAGSFRQYINKLKPLIEIKIKTRPIFYKLRGLYLDEKLTDKYTDMPISRHIFADLDVIMSSTKHRPPKMHDLRLEFSSSDLYDSLQRIGWSIDPSNKTIYLPTFSAGNRDTKIHVHKNNSVLIIIGCTYQPIDYSTNGFIDLNFHLGRILSYIESLNGKQFPYEPVTRWRMKYFHLNQDSIEYNFRDDNHTIHLVTEHAQLYNKQLENNNQIFRYEKHLSLNLTLEEEINSDRFQEMKFLSEN